MPGLIVQGDTECRVPYYIRTVRADNKDPLTALLKDVGVPNEPAIGKEDSTTIFSFPQKAPHKAKVVADDTAIEQLEIWNTYQEHWCEHKPSVTVYYRDEEFLDVGGWVYKRFDSISGVSFLPRNDHVYQQAPYQEITKEEYKDLKKGFPEIDYSMLSKYEFEDMTKGSQELACSAGVCEIVDI